MTVKVSLACRLPVVWLPPGLSTVSCITLRPYCIVSDRRAPNPTRMPRSGRNGAL